MFRISFDESMKNFDKNRFITILSVFLFACLFILEGFSMSYYTINEYRKESSKHESLQSWGLYCMSSRLPSRRVFLEDPSLDNNLDIETLEFWEKVESLENLEYVILDDGNICTEFYEKLLKYPHLLYDKSFDRNFLDGEGLTLYCMYVSPNFHKVEYYRVIEGRDFTDEDMVYNEGQSRAVLLGYKFRDVFNVGDVIELNANDNYYLGDITEVPSLKVIGFIEEDTTVLGIEGFPIYDLDSYIIIPAINISAEDYAKASESVKKITVNADFMTTMYKTKFLIPEGYEEEVLPQLQKALDEYSGFAKYYSIVDKKAYVERSQARTEALTEFSSVVTSVLAVFALVTMVISVFNRISRNRKDYAIHIAVGATSRTVAVFLAFEMFLVLVFSFIMNLIILKPIMEYEGMPFITNASWISWGLTSAVILFIAVITSIISIRKYNVCTLIK